MSKRIAVLGVSGVGKSSLIKKVNEAIPVMHLQASELIKAEQAYRLLNPDSSETLRTGPVIDNQALMIAAFWRESATTNLPVIFDGHSIIDGPDGLIEIPSAVFSGLRLDAICFLAAEPLVIVERRQADVGRKRPYRDAAYLHNHQAVAEVAARRIAKDIERPFIYIVNGKIDQLRDLVVGL